MVKKMLYQFQKKIKHLKHLLSPLKAKQTNQQNEIQREAEKKIDNEKLKKKKNKM
jgi:hypothetical protein